MNHQTNPTNNLFMLLGSIYPTTLFCMDYAVADDFLFSKCFDNLLESNSYGSTTKALTG